MRLDLIACGATIYRDDEPLVRADVGVTAAAMTSRPDMTAGSMKLRCRVHADRRRALTATIAVALLVPLVATPRANAVATLDLSRLLLHRADAPFGYDVDRGNTYAIKLGHFDRSRRPTRVATPAGYGGGRFTRFLHTHGSHWMYIDSAVFILADPRGAGSSLEAYVRLLARTHESITLGDAAWVDPTSNPARGNLVIWRYGSAVAFVHAYEFTGHEKTGLALAQKQQRRIRAVLG
jgi:hypothetical protein